MNKQSESEYETVIIEEDEESEEEDELKHDGDDQKLNEGRN